MNQNKHFIKYTFAGLIMTAIFLASSTTVSADPTLPDEASESTTVCAMNGIGTDSHNASIEAGRYNSAIGETVFRAFCNDNDGFAVYAIGYTDGQNGKNVLTDSSLGSDYDIISGTGTNGATSQWAMKVSAIASPSITHPVTIENSFESFREIPQDYTMVAKQNAGTNSGTIMTEFNTSYQAYVSNTQPAGTYVGQVKYILVHPNYVDKDTFRGATTVTFEGNGQSFPDGSTQNIVQYANICKPGDYAYVSNDYQEVTYDSIISDGELDNSEESAETFYKIINLPGAYKVKVELDYDIPRDTGILGIFQGIFTPESQEGPEDYIMVGEHFSTTGSQTHYFDGDTITVAFGRFKDLDFEPEYRFNVKAIPVYDTAQPNSVGKQIPSNDCIMTSFYGNYTTTTERNDTWYATLGEEFPLPPFFNDPDFYTLGDEKIYFRNERGLLKILGFLNYYLHINSLTLYASNPYLIRYDGNGATGGSMDGFTSKVDMENGDVVTNLLAPNFYKTGYGFAGWSPNPHAAVNSNDIIYGPNESITTDQLVFDEDTKSTTLYAVWVPTSGTMQRWSGCYDMHQGEVTALTDIRDGNVYTVGKLAGGDCWMMENLRLESANSVDESLAAGFIGGFVGLAESENANFGSINSNSLYSFPYDSDRYPRYNNNNTRINDNTLVVSPGDKFANGLSEATSKWYGYGNYYTWAAAAATTILYPGFEAVNSSICPKGWTLPVGSRDGGQFANLTMNGGDLVKYPNNFVTAGTWQDSSAINRGISGVYWSDKTYQAGACGASERIEIMQTEDIGDLLGPSCYTSAYSQSIGADNTIHIFGWSPPVTTGASVRCRTNGERSSLDAK